MRVATGNCGLINTWWSKFGREDAGVPDVAHAGRVQNAGVVCLCPTMGQRRWLRPCEPVTNRFAFSTEAENWDFFVEPDLAASEESGVRFVVDFQNALFKMGSSAGLILVRQARPLELCSDSVAAPSSVGP